MGIDQNWLLASLFVFVAAVVRGVTGFGFAAVAVVGLAMLEPLNRVVPLVLCLEVTTSLLLLPSVRRQADRTLLVRLVIAAALGVPCGIWMLTAVDGRWLTLGVYLLVGLLALLGLARVALPIKGGQFALWLTGASTGALIAAFSTGGPLLVAWLNQKGLNPATLRATLIQYFFVADLLALIGLAIHSSITDRELINALLVLPALLVGQSIGSRLFFYIPPSMAQRLSQWLLLVLAAAGLFSWWKS